MNPSHLLVRCRGGIPVLKLRKGGTEQMRSGCWEALPCPSEESIAYSNKRMKERFFHVLHTHISFSISALHIKIYYLLTDLSRELNCHRKAFVLCQWHSVNFHSVTGCWSPAFTVSNEMTLILPSLQTVLLQSALHSTSNIRDKPTLPKLSYIGTFRKIN